MTSPATGEAALEAKVAAKVTQFFVEVLGILRDASASVHSERRDCWTASPGDVFDKVKAAADRACAPGGGAAEVRAALEEYKAAVADRLHYDMNETLEKGSGLRAVRKAALEEAARAIENMLDPFAQADIGKGINHGIRISAEKCRSLAASQTPPGGSDR